MKIISVNVGALRDVPGGSGKTGAFKTPVEGRVWVGRLGLEGDTIVNTKVHGGPDQAVYLYPQPDLDHFTAMLGRDLPPGSFGENLTIEGPESDDLCFGDRFRIGEVVLELTSPREPCRNFGRMMADDTFPGRLRLEGRAGAYARVISEGEIAAGDDYEVIPFDGPRVPVAVLLRPVDPALVPALLATPLHPKARAALIR